MLTVPDQAMAPRPPLLMWLTPQRDFVLRLVFALVFLAGLGAALTVLAPPPTGPAVRIALPPPLPDPDALLPYLPETARAANATMPLQPPAIAAPEFRLSPAGTAAADAGVLARALDCLAAAAWYEAGDDPPGMRAVVQVVLNRARHPAFPASVCGVVWQGSERTTGCQFSFTCDGSMQTRHPGAAAWARARAVASAALFGAVDPRVGLATHYHADYVVPVWRSGLVKLAQVGLHLFYRWPGNWGSPVALRGAGSGVEPRIPALAALSQAHGNAGGDAAAGLTGLTGADPAYPARAAPLAYLPLDEADSHAHLAASGKTASTAAAGSPSASGTRIVLMLDPAAFPGTYAMQALAACAERERCAVIGNLLGVKASGSSAEAPGFIYVRDRRTGAEGAWWNCQALPRANPNRCLPQGSALARLLAEWH